ncbi:hypothetical protein C1645_763449 [Glomus cerebriforme]|uniref:HMG box domain-containing protein n=1 Tax=Glomus cerebriforme TaxID=658196 RepID=A0A397T3K6_9GLOM|nr:hypothetical protein C1645_763449 [Glomus cerebriforme]
MKEKMFKIVRPTNILFHLNPKSDLEMIEETNYKFNLDPDILINNSETSRLAERNRKKGIKKPPRRQNAWIIYRRDKSAKPEFKGKKSKDISVEIAKSWNEEPRETVLLFEALSRLSTLNHIKRYGDDYKYSPKKSSKPKSAKKSVFNQNS